MEISKEEYCALKKQVSILQSQIHLMQAPKKITSLEDKLRERPISSVRNLAEDRPVFGYACLNADAWSQAFILLAKLIHEPSDLFYMDTTHGPYGRKLYIRSLRKKERLRKIADFTPEQVAISIEMLDELIPIYNKYFKMTHQKVMYDPTGRGDYVAIKVADEDVLKKGGVNA